MAIIKNGVNGTVSGKAGSVVFVLTKTGNYVHSFPRVKKMHNPEDMHPESGYLTTIWLFGNILK